MSQKENITRTHSITSEILLAIGLVVLGVLLRVAFGDIPNFAPVAAIGLFSGFCLSRKTIAIVIPLAIMLISNIWFGGYHWLVMLSVYACYMVMPFAGSFLKNAFRSQTSGFKSAVATRLAAIAVAVSGSLLFFVVTNLAVWMSASDQTIWQCYATAIPFFRYTLCGDLFFTFAIFASFDALMVLVPMRKFELAA